ncbi:probable inactive leucine-rich repeat receptor-like protein kinase At3g03770 [Nymphaea colorata]|nr:probable inactive leucine-rich repeat receptor-like protein kinase At3g03770 [Nymphaea colorata]
MEGLPAVLLLTVFSWALLLPGTQQLQASQTEVLQQLRKHLQYPKALDVWNSSNDLCSIPGSQAVSIVCNGDSVVELKVVGDKPSKVGDFEGVPIPGQTLTGDFSMDSFVTTLTRLSSLKAVSLVSLGMWGPLPDKIHRLDSLEAIDLSSNFLYGPIPDRMSSMGSLQTWVVDNNFLNGSLPDWFGTFANLTILSMKNNRFDGSIPRSIGTIKTLTVLGFSGNGISGALPNLGGLTKLQVLDLRNNKLDSRIPVLPGSLVTVLLSKNLLSDEIPEHFGELKALQHLDLSYNFLKGRPPSVIFSLPNITYLNLAMNMLSGSLPSNLNCGSGLGFVDVSSNRLTGGLPPCLSSHSDKRVVIFSGNCLSIDPQHQHKLPFCRGVDNQEKASNHGGIWLLIGVIGGIVVLVLLLGLLSLPRCRQCWKKRKEDQQLLPKPVPVTESSPTGFSTELLANARYVQTMKLGTQGLPVYRQFTVAELEEATDNLSQSAYMGENSFGKVYKGRLENGTYVAVRCFTLIKKYQIRNLKLRLDLLAKLRHPHLVWLLGHCIDGAPDESYVNRVFLVYEYIPNGNLQAHISANSEKGLKWSERLAVLIGVAKAVHFLHTGIIPGFFHNQLKSKNILIDEHGISKLSDYGLSIFIEELEKLQARADGKSVLMDSKCSSRLTTEDDDVYSFGFILLETLVGSSAFQKEESGLLSEMGSFSSQDEQKRVVDPIVLCTCAQESLSIVMSITNKCLLPDPSGRPSIEDVLWNLQYAAQVQATADGDQRSEDASSI